MSTCPCSLATSSGDCPFCKSTERLVGCITLSICDTPSQSQSEQLFSLVCFYFLTVQIPRVQELHHFKQNCAQEVEQVWSLHRQVYVKGTEGKWFIARHAKGGAQLSPLPTFTSPSTNFSWGAGALNQRSSATQSSTQTRAVKSWGRPRLPQNDF